MATIKAIEGSSVHQIQSGQVIVDLCSVVKELVENALDASATSLEVRFKNNGLDSIEVVDNGGGIAPEDFDSLALKHYTSKLAKYDDLSSLTTFGFRGEALSSLCALSKLGVTTSRAEDAPKGTRLEFETSGKVKSQSIVAATKGTTVAVEEIFRNLPVRRRELEKNIKREYQKVLGLLHAYACISTGVRFSVSNVPSKGKKVVIFSTNSNPKTRENIANVYGAKTLVALVPLDLTLELHPTTASTQTAKSWSTQADTDKKNVRLTGHISRPVVGEGRQTPDRQMMFVNSRPCALPQVSKAINEVYKSYNVTQSPFIFANLELDTNAYDVNVSPDKRTILLHNQTALLEALKDSLTELFEKHDQSVPTAATPSIKKLPSFKPLSVTRPPAVDEASEDEDEESSSAAADGAVQPSSIIRRSAEGEYLQSRENATKIAMNALAAKRRRKSEKEAKDAEKENAEDSISAETLPAASIKAPRLSSAIVSTVDASSAPIQAAANQLPRPVQDFNARMGVAMPAREEDAESPVAEAEKEEAPEGLEEQQEVLQNTSHREDVLKATPEDKIPSVSNTPQKVTPGVVPNAFDRMRPKRTPQDVATITIGNQTTSMTLGTPEAKKRRIHTPKTSAKAQAGSQGMPGFVSTLRAFSAPGTHPEDDEDEEMEEADLTRATPSFAKPRTRSAQNLPLSSSMTATVTSLSSEAHDIDDRPVEEQLDSALFLASEDGSDDEYMDDAEKKAREEARIAKLIELAEEKAARPTSDHVKRAASVMKSRIRKDSTLQLMQTIDTSVVRIERGLKQLGRALDEYVSDKEKSDGASTEESTRSAEERLSLTVSKHDFSRMRIIGQFNLGFILATRTSTTSDAQDELFIIDQHASDEKYNFERLTSQTIVQNQRLVHPKQLDLTAIEEEIILNQGLALEKNGFEITVDTTGESAVGQRCKLTSLPMSREVTFSLSDLEELLALLSDQPSESTSSANVPRPSKVRKMFAMRACRSSIMVGKTLTNKQMEKVVRHMGELDKPWNCPHGRPTMRHLFSMDGWNSWGEGAGLAGFESEEDEVDWSSYVAKGKEMGLLDDEQDDGGEQSHEEAMDEDPAEWLFTQGKINDNA